MENTISNVGYNVLVPDVSKNCAENMDAKKNETFKYSDEHERFVSAFCIKRKQWDQEFATESNLPHEDDTKMRETGVVCENEDLSYEKWRYGMCAEIQALRKRKLQLYFQLLEVYEELEKLERSLELKENHRPKIPQKKRLHFKKVLVSKYQEKENVKYTLLRKRWLRQFLS